MTFQLTRQQVDQLLKLLTVSHTHKIDDDDSPHRASLADVGDSFSCMEFAAMTRFSTTDH